MTKSVPSPARLSDPETLMKLNAKILKLFNAYFPELVVLIEHNMEIGRFTQESLEMVYSRLFAAFDKNPAAILDLHPKMADFLADYLYKRRDQDLDAKTQNIDSLRGGLILRFLLNNKFDRFDPTTSGIIVSLLALHNPKAGMIALKDIPDDNFYKSPYLIALENMKVIKDLWERYLRLSKAGIHSLHSIDSSMVDLTAINIAYDFIDFLNEINSLDLSKEELQDPGLASLVLKFPLANAATDNITTVKRKHAKAIFIIVGCLDSNDKSETAIALRAEALKLIAQNPITLTKVCLRLLAKNEKGAFEKYTSKKNFSDNLHVLIIDHLAVAHSYAATDGVIEQLKQGIVGDAKCAFQAMVAAAVQSGKKFVSKLTLAELRKHEIALYTTAHLTRQYELLLTNFLGGCFTDQIKDLIHERKKLPVGVEESIAISNFADKTTMSPDTISALVRKLSFVLLKPNTCPPTAEALAIKLKNLLITASYIGTKSIDLQFFGRGSMAEETVILNDLAVRLEVCDSSDPTKPGWKFSDKRGDGTEAITFNTDNVDAVVAYIMLNCTVNNLAQVTNILVAPQFGKHDLGNSPMLRRSFTPTHLKATIDAVADNPLTTISRSKSLPDNLDHAKTKTNGPDFSFG